MSQHFSKKKSWFSKQVSSTNFSLVLIQQRISWKFRKVFICEGQLVLFSKQEWCDFNHENIYPKPCLPSSSASRHDFPSSKWDNSNSQHLATKRSNIYTVLMDRKTIFENWRIRETIRLYDEDWVIVIVRCELTKPESNLAYWGAGLYSATRWAAFNIISKNTPPIFWPKNRS